MAQGQSQQLTATATFSDGSTADVTESVAWSSADPAIATVTDMGLLTGVDIGSSIITVKKDGIISNSVSIQVTDAIITAFQITSSTSIAQGQTQQLAATATYSDGSTADVTSSVIWLSADPAIANVTPTGLLTGSNIGVTFISASK